jgi:hypothetical protein
MGSIEFQSKVCRRKRLWTQVRYILRRKAHICEMRITTLLITILVNNEQNQYLHIHDSTVHRYVEQKKAHRVHLVTA